MSRIDLNGFARIVQNCFCSLWNGSFLCHKRNYKEAYKARSELKSKMGDEDDLDANLCAAVQPSRARSGEGGRTNQAHSGSTSSGDALGVSTTLRALPEGAPCSPSFPHLSSPQQNKEQEAETKTTLNNTQPDELFPNGTRIKSKLTQSPA